MTVVVVTIIISNSLSPSGGANSHGAPSGVWPVYPASRAAAANAEAAGCGLPAGPVVRQQTPQHCHC